MGTPNHRKRFVGHNARVAQNSRRFSAAKSAATMLARSLSEQDLSVLRGETPASPARLRKLRAQLLVDEDGQPTILGIAMTKR